MCGLAGFVAREGEALAAVAGEMAACLRHRGPDDAAEWTDAASQVAFGFRRLSVLDLTGAGRQPMLSADGRFALMCNGEIYNHRELREMVGRDAGGRAWTGHSDTEVLLACCAAWGIERALQRAVGMFAVALYDQRERRLFLARDRFGEKPLYYGWLDGAFAFASELGALRSHPGFDNPIDRDVVGLYMQQGHVPAPYSIYQDIYKLQPGCVLTIAAEAAAARPAHALFAPARHESLRIDRYWSAAQTASAGFHNPMTREPEAVDRLHAALSDAVRLQSVADVPLGTFLSGGLDSSLVAAVAQEQAGSPIRTFAIGFTERAFDEAPFAAAVARHLRTDHTELYVPAEQALALVPDLPRLYAEPLADASQIPAYFLSKLARGSVTVALTGDGADELFGGYPQHYRWAALWPWVSAVPRPLRASAGTLLASLPGTTAHRAGEWLGGSRTLEGFYRRIVGAWPDAAIVQGAAPLPTILGELEGWEPEASAAERMMVWDAVTRLPDEMLHKVDRASMAVSLETRAPFLDHRVAEIAWRLPLRMKIRDGRGKWIVRALLNRYVPPALVDRPKQGFDVPVDAWLRGPLRDWAEALLDARALRHQGFLDAARVRRTWTQHLSGARNWRRRLWPVLMFQAWLAENSRVPPTHH